MHACGALAGNGLVHGDLRPDNLIVGEDRAVIVDWNWLTTGPAWTDWVGLVPTMAWQGMDAVALVRDSPLCADADPEQIDAFLAAIAVYMLSSLDQPPMSGCLPAVRHHQHLMARMFLAMLGTRRGW